MIYLYILLLLLGCVQSNDDLLISSQGIVDRETFAHYRILNAGNVLINLITLKGDADIYVSHKDFATYDPSVYDFHSATCGMDYVVVPYSFQKPFSVGIYGHPSYENSSYLLEVYDLDGFDKDKFELVYISIGETKKIKKLGNNNKEGNTYKMAAKTGLWALFEIFHLIFL
ncbi:unnamed protein product [Brassicogethes aeneus]|uniref:Uncharacterized protein n=1 Tax=Brassicogethes aeneus TaxID=1431903 RepID=A0A9P0B6D2_BRAAE|nr:unnamed protein product [Brassicogethes aeneus]